MKTPDPSEIGATDERLLDLAGRINDATPVDWNTPSPEAPDLQRKLRRMRSLEAIAAAYRDSSGPRPESPPLARVAAGDRTAIPPPAPEQVIFTWGPLRVVEELGAGSYGRVYRAYDPALARYVALKLWKERGAGAGHAPEAPGAPDAPASEATVRRLVEEARRMARVRHPNVLVIHGVDTHDGRPGLWCDLLSGETLEARLTRGQRLSAPEAAFVGIELCRALAAIHAAGLAHGDIKSSNVVRDAGGAIVLLDFGSSRASGPSDDPGGPLSGTPLVMSPERLGRASLGPADDLYALGVLLYRLTSGHYPVEAASHAELEARLRRGERVPLRDHRPDLPGPFVQVVERALHTDPGERYASAGALEAALWGTLQIATPADGAGRVPTGAGTPRWWPGAALVLAAVVALSLWVVRLPAPRTGAGLTTPPPFEVEATLFRTDDAGVARLTDGSRVQPGDRLYLEVVAGAPLYTYVIDEDDHGALFVLYPVPGLEPANPLPPGKPHRLPGTLGGAAQDWQVTSAGGRETVLVVTSPKPLPLLEARLAAMTPVQPGQPPMYAALDPEALKELRGIGGLVASDTLRIDRPGTRLKDLAEGLNAAAARGEIWVRTISLDNP